MEPVTLIEVKEDILSDNNAVASELRNRLRESKTFLLNLMASPGAGKTTLILKTIEALKEDLNIAVLEADIDSTVDAEKVAAAGVAAIQLRTGGFCHLDAGMVSQGITALDLAALDLVIIENVGNLICPAQFDTGAFKDAMILSVPEGDDKPLKYPSIFSVSNALVVNKIDYLDLSDFNLDAMKARVRALNTDCPIFEVSAKTGQGIADWADWLKRQCMAFQSDPTAVRVTRP